MEADPTDWEAIAAQQAMYDRIEQEYGAAGHEIAGCDAEGCFRDVFARGLCGMHYLQGYRAGTLKN